MSRIWEACRDAARPGRLAGTLLRLVESQEQVATNALVDDLAEQALLEHLLERTKPPLRPGTAGLHYLLATPFRYPPLRHGSRFGTATEPSLLYGALERATVLAEAAYYRFVFWYGMTRAPDPPLTTQHTLFGTAYTTTAGLRLQDPPFAAFHTELTDPADYSACQTLGSALRGQGIQAIEYRSARAPVPGINVGLFSPAALADSAPAFQEPWLCQTDGERVRFYSRQDGGTHAFAVDTFLVAGCLPMPAA